MSSNATTGTRMPHDPFNDPDELNRRLSFLEHRVKDLERNFRFAGWIVGAVLLLYNLKWMLGK